MKYKNKQDFIGACNKDEGFRDSIGREITEADLKKYNILPDVFGNYSKAQRYELSWLIRKNEGFEFFDREQITKVLSAQLHLGKGVLPENVQKFLLRYLSDKFQKEIKQLRKEFNIPENGFGPKDARECSELFMKWKKEINKLPDPCADPKNWDERICPEKREFYKRRRFNQKAYLDALIFLYYGNKIRNHYKFEMGARLGNLDKVSPFFTIMKLIQRYKGNFRDYWRFEKRPLFDAPELPEISPFIDTLKLLQKYNPTIFFNVDGLLEWLYVIGSIIMFDIWKLPVTVSPFKTSPVSLKRKEDELNIIISAPLKKQDLISYINKNWLKIKTDLHSIFGSMSESKDLLRDYLIIQLKNQGKTAGEIKNILRKEAQYDLKVDQVRQILRRTKKKIKQLGSA